MDVLRIGKGRECVFNGHFGAKRKAKGVGRRAVVVEEATAIAAQFDAVCRGESG